LLSVCLMFSSVALSSPVSEEETGQSLLMMAPGDLHENIALQQPPQLVANFLMRAVRGSAALSGFRRAAGKLAPQLIVETRYFFAEHNKMHQRIGVDYEDHKWRQGKKGEERQFDIEEGQFHGTFDAVAALRDLRDMSVAKTGEHCVLNP
jgi:hypothetical protein